MKKGAVGGKMLGAGGGGFILFFVEPANRKCLLKTFNKLLHVPFRFECTGSQIIYYSEMGV
jgi:D-glycero-alpha-D-manno-heptose-7-phosphate kinase